FPTPSGLGCRPSPPSGDPTVSRRVHAFRSVPLLLLLGASGCYDYVVTDFAVVPPGEHVRVLVTPSVVPTLEEITTVRGRQIRGVVVAREEGDLFLRIPIVQRQLGFHSAELGQDVRLRP